MQNKPIIIIPGEPDSIFFEIFFKSLTKKKFKSPLILICCNKLLNKEINFFNSKIKIKILNVNQVLNRSFDNKYVNIINVDLYDSKNRKNINNYLKNSFNLAFNLIRNGLTNKLVNGPINKRNFLNKRFLGMTEFISKNFEAKKTGMLIYNKELSVCPVTTHLPIKLVTKKITKKLISEKIDIIDKFFKNYLKVQAKIAVAGLNPHCESILKFNEDEKILSPVIKMKFKKGVNVKGPFSADTLFLKKNRKKFNVILGMYHDQVLGPAKSLFEFNAINITMGLPFLRVTPDHGPNFRMFKKNKSNPLSLIKTLKFLDNK